MTTAPHTIPVESQAVYQPQVGSPRPIAPAFVPRVRATPKERPHARMSFSEAFAHWIERRTMFHSTMKTNAHIISERTEWDYRQYARALDKSFAAVKLSDIDANGLEQYQHDRAFCLGAWAKPAGANRISKEVAMLVRILREAGCWSEEQEEDFNRIRPVEPDISRALSPEEQLIFLKTASSREEWAFIYAYSIAALQTTMSTNELRNLLVSDINLLQGIVQVRRVGAKNRHRIRTIPIETQECRWAFEMLVWRAVQFGGGAPHHYLFPFGARGGRCYDHAKPMSDSGIKKRWNEVRTAAGFEWLRPYDLRHTAITRMAEAGVSISTILAFAGHMSVKMQQHYTAISMTAKRKAMASAWTRGVPRPVYGNMPARPCAPAESHNVVCISVA